jgi:hypothetical protein
VRCLIGVQVTPRPLAAAARAGKSRVPALAARPGPDPVLRLRFSRFGLNSGFTHLGARRLVCPTDVERNGLHMNG